MNDDTRAKALAHAKREAPREACGLVVVIGRREDYVACRNIAPGADQFAIDPHDWAAAEDRGDIVAIFHSHPGAGPEPSEADRAACEETGLAWHIVGLPTERWATLEPSGYVTPLIGREFSHGVLDCYGLIRDYYKQECGVALRDFQRLNDWWSQGGNLYLENFAAAGFVRVDLDKDFSMRQHDVLLMQIAAPVPNHGAVYAGDGTILHHLYGQLSSRVVYGGYYRKHTTHVLRYTGGNAAT
jgi:proteasome lid subunit RPN8/RPN11